MFFTYIIYSKSVDKYYVGHSENLNLRLQRHKEGSTRFTSQTDDWELMYYETFLTKSEAMKRENEIKKRKSRKYIEGIISHAGGRPVPPDSI